MIPLLACVLVAGVVRPAMGQENDAAEDDRAVTPLPLIPVPDNPQAPPLFDYQVPSEGFRSDSERWSEIASTVDLGAWNARREFWGFGPLAREVLLDQALVEELVRSSGEYDLPVMSGELDHWLKLRERSVALAHFHDAAAKADGYLDARVDELHGTMTVWGTAALVDQLAAPPEGVQFVLTDYSRDDIDSFLASNSQFKDDLAEVGLQLVSTVERSDGATLLVAPRRHGVDLASASEAFDLVLQEQASLTGVRFPVRTEITSTWSEKSQFCNNRARCDNPVGGVIWGGCTSGFVIRDPGTNRRGVSTAGHCTSAGPFSIRGLDTDMFGISGTMALSLSTASPDLERNDEFMDLEIHRGAESEAGAFPATYFRDSTYGNRGIQGQVFPANGSRVCLSARNTIQRRCGVVEDNDFDNSPFTQNGIRWDLDAGLTTEGGDSGGPVTLDSDSTLAVVVHKSTLIEGPDVGDGVGYPVSSIPTYMEGRFIQTVSSSKQARTDSFSARLYRNALQRTSTIADMQYWSAQVAGSGTCVSTAQWIVDYFLTGGELQSAVPLISNTNKQRRIHRLYWAALNRAPDLSGRDYWVSQLVTEANWQSIVDYFVFGTSEGTAAINSIVGTEWGPCP